MPERAGLNVAEPLASFVEDRLLPLLGIASEGWWRGVADVFDRFAPANRALLERRTELQSIIDARYDAGEEVDEAWLRKIGYIVPEPGAFQIGTRNVDAEIATMAGPQLVVPALNARFVLNAVNARWGSLYDALYGTDAVAGAARSNGYDSERGALVIARAKAFLDDAVPLTTGSWTDFGGSQTDIPIADLHQFVGKTDRGSLFIHHGLHIEIIFDRSHPIGASDRAGIADVILESALTTIVDLEDSIAAVDAEDKVAAYANWLGLMQGDLEETFNKGGRAVTRRMAADRVVRSPEGSELTLPGRSLLFVRNVGHLMTTQAVVLADGTQAPEGILDAIMTATIGAVDLKRLGRFVNSRARSIYIVKPKMHGPEECAFTDRLFNAVEDLLALERHTIKIGVMDEERRTSANLAACIAAVKDRIAFINTGFLDRTGDEIHTAMRAGPMVPKAEMKATGWIGAYEDRNVRIGLVHGLSGRAQIGKGMWAAPDKMADMLAQKSAHPMSGANTAWVPSPTAATLHAMHYHQVDVFGRQEQIGAEPIPPVSALLDVPVARDRRWGEWEVARELDNNAQGILGYVVRWVDHGVGCSKVPDIDDVGLMEDRATLRISSQHMANWMLHGVARPADIDAALLRMAAKVDEQNAGDPDYVAMAQHPDGLAYAAARALVFEGAVQPNGYTEPLLHDFRLRAKAKNA